MSLTFLLLGTGSHHISTIFFSIKNLRGQSMSLTFLLRGTGSHHISLIIHTRGRNVNSFHLYSQAFEDHNNSVLAVGNLLAATVTTDKDFDGILWRPKILWSRSWLTLAHFYFSCRSESSNISL